MMSQGPVTFAFSVGTDSHYWDSVGHLLSIYRYLMYSPQCPILVNTVSSLSFSGLYQAGSVSLYCDLFEP